ncbi:MAG: hypothetical protein N3A65_06355 [candidate division WOR-3 bacterium]|nr:hypothetical protein [candidate division WOR-3 bacterium]
MNNTGPVSNPAVVKMIKSMVVRKNRPCIWGGVFLLLPAFIFGAGALSFNISATDNINMLSLKKLGLVFSVAPIYDFRDHFGLHYDGAFSLINLVPENLIIENYLRVEKIIDFKGFGNKNTITGRIYNFFPISYSIYQMFDFGLTDSLNLYIKDRYLWIPYVKLKYRYFISDSISDYAEARLGTGIRIPLPYFYFTPYAGIGMRYVNQEISFLSTLLVDLTFPLTGDFSAGTYMRYDCAGKTENAVSGYADDPFFEYENLHQAQEISFALHRIFGDSKITASFSGYKKDFFVVYNQTRQDKGLWIKVDYTKIIGRKTAYSLGLESLHNFSTVSDFDYIKNSILLNIRLTF